MTPKRPHTLDEGIDIEGLVHRGMFDLPDTILDDGTASPDQFAIVPPKVSFAKAMLLHREYHGSIAAFKGAALVGTREPDFAPYLRRFRPRPREHITTMESSDAILGWLFDMTGYRYAPAAFWKVAGWEIGWIANWLSRVRGEDASARLIVAERQAAVAVRAMYIAHLRCGAGADLLEVSGAILAARAVIDMVTMFDIVLSERLAAGTYLDEQTRRSIARTRDVVLQRLGACIRALVEADRAMGNFATGRKLGRMLDHARELVEAIGLFTVASEDVALRVVRVEIALARSGKPAPALAVNASSAIAALASDVEVLVADRDDGVALDRADWCTEMVGDLCRLEKADSDGRRAALDKVRTDLVYKLIVTRRLDRLFEALPWMGAPSAAFPRVFGGPLGAMAALFEAGRSREIALELKLRVLDDPRGSRLDARRGEFEYSDPNRVTEALRFQTRAGFLLTASAMSHHMVQARLAGRHFAASHPLPTLEDGRLDYHFETSMQDPQTMRTVTQTELGKPLYGTMDYDRDMPRYDGMTIADVLAAPLLEAFPSDYHNELGSFFKRANERRAELNQADLPLCASGAGAANRELLRSALKSIDTPTDGVDAPWRDDDVVARAPADVELARFDGRSGGHVGAGRNADGGAVRLRATAIRTAKGSPGAHLRHIVDQARTWRTTKSPSADDGPLAALLSGRHLLSGLVPVGHLFAPILWFRPGIDSHIHDWIGNGAPLWSPLALNNIVHAGVIAREVQLVTGRWRKLFGATIPFPLRHRIMVPLWTGLASIMADHTHVG